MILVVIRILSFHGRFRGGSRRNDDGVALLRNLLQIEFRNGRRILLLLLRHIAVVVGQRRGARCWSFRGPWCRYGNCHRWRSDGRACHKRSCRNAAPVPCRGCLRRPSTRRWERWFDRNRFWTKAYPAAAIRARRSKRRSKSPGCVSATKLVDRRENSFARRLLFGQVHGCPENHTMFQKTCMLATSTEGPCRLTQVAPGAKRLSGACPADGTGRVAPAGGAYWSMPISRARRVWL